MQSASPTQRRTAKRGNGEGSIYFQESSKLWRSAVTLPGGKRKYLSGKTRQEVAHKLAKTLRELQQGIAPADDRQTVASWLKQYVDGLEAQKVAHNTLVRYRGVLNNYLIPQLGKIRLSQLQPQTVKVYQDDLARRGLGVSSIAVHRVILGSALKQAVAFGVIPRNVVSLVKPPRRNAERESKGKMLTPDEARALLGAIRGDRLEALYLLLVTAGLRRGEALGLRWIDLEIDAPSSGTLHVRQQMQLVRGVPTLVPVKSRKGIRSIPLPSLTVDALLNRRECQIVERELVGEASWRADGLVFNAEDGAPLHRSTMTRQFHMHTRTAGLAHFRPHDLRHTYGSLLMSQGVPLKTISELMGHASIEVTADIYLHSLDVQVRDTAHSVERALSAPVSRLEGVCAACGRGLPSTPQLPDSGRDSGRVAAQVAA